MRVKDSGHPIDTICVACPDHEMLSSPNPPIWELVAPRFCGFRICFGFAAGSNRSFDHRTTHLDSLAFCISCGHSIHRDNTAFRFTAFRLHSVCVQRFRFNVFTKQSVRCRGSNVRVFCSLRTTFAVLLKTYLLSGRLSMSLLAFHFCKREKVLESFSKINS